MSRCFTRCRAAPASSPRECSESLRWRWQSATRPRDRASPSPQGSLAIRSGPRRMRRCRVNLRCWPRNWCVRTVRSGCGLSQEMPYDVGNFFHDWITPHILYSSTNSGGVQITGGSYPAPATHHCTPTAPQRVPGTGLRPSRAVSEPAQRFRPPPKKSLAVTRRPLEDETLSAYTHLTADCQGRSA